ncbi:MAG: hypothetical protein NWF00_04835 [Candidatus Bathyarchaeota archaeon]|nr:hypothetical protein [Candidatus Bathyarchaeota archaeon]
MNVTDILNIYTSSQFWPFFLAFLGGYVMMNVFLGRDRVVRYSELEKVLIAFGFGMLFWGSFFLAPTLAASVWFIFPAGISPLTLSAIIFCLISILALPSAVKPVPSEAVKRLTLLVLFIEIFVIWVFSFFFTSAFAGLRLYEFGIFWFLYWNWASFVTYLWMALALSICGTIFLWVYLYERLNVTLHNPFKKATLPKLKRILGSRFFLVYLVSIPLILLAGFSAVPVDRSLHVFTPGLIGHTELVPSTDNIAYLHLTRNWDDVSVSFSYYSLYSTSEEISQPFIPWGLKSVYLANPSNASLWIRDLTGVTSAIISDWPPLQIDVPVGVTYEPIYEQEGFSEVSAVTVSFGNYSGSSKFLVNFTYYQKSDTSSTFSVERNQLEIVDLGNGTWLETIGLQIRNNSPVRVQIPGVKYDHLYYANYTQIYDNETARPYDSLLSQRDMALFAVVEPNSAKNITMVISQTKNPLTY